MSSVLCYSVRGGEVFRIKIQCGLKPSSQSSVLPRIPSPILPPSSLSTSYNTSPVFSKLVDMAEQKVMQADQAPVAGQPCSTEEKLINHGAPGVGSVLISPPSTSTCLPRTTLVTGTLLYPYPRPSCWHTVGSAAGGLPLLSPQDQRDYDP